MQLQIIVSLQELSHYVGLVLRASIKSMASYSRHKAACMYTVEVSSLASFNQFLENGLVQRLVAMQSQYRIRHGHIFLLALDILS